MISPSLWEILFISLLMTPLSPVTYLILLTSSSLFPLLGPWQNHKLVKHNFPYVSKLSTLCILRYPSSLPASLVCPSPSTFSPCPAVGVSPFSCCSLHVVSWFVLCNCSSMSLDHVKKKVKFFLIFIKAMPRHSQHFSGTYPPANSRVRQYSKIFQKIMHIFGQNMVDRLGVWQGQI